jgi:hypothetical protein
MSTNDTLSVEEAVALLELDLKIEPGFLTRLADEDDWSFVIKSHAFLEAALSHLLSDALSEPSLQSVFANTETSNNKSGKLAFLKHLDLLNEDARRFIRSFSELRNSLVHDIGQVGFSFSGYVDSLDKQQTDSFVKAFGYFANGPTFEHNGKSLDTRDFLVKNPKQGIWYSVMALCAVIYLSKDLAGLRKLLRSLQAQINAGPPKATSNNSFKPKPLRGSA